jgi:diguanylate cyclase (GGDEF)-like protein
LPYLVIHATGSAVASFFSLQVPAFSLRARLILLFFVAAGPLLISNIFDLRAERGERLQAAADKANGIARHVATTEQSLFDAANLMLRAASRTLGLQPDLADCSRVLQLVNDADVLRSLLLLDASGNIICSSRPIPARVNLADRPYFHEAMASRRFVLSDLVVSRLSGEPTITAALSIPGASGEAERVLVAALDLSLLADRVADIAKAADVTVFVTDAAANIVAAYPDSDLWTGRSLGELEFRHNPEADSDNLLEGRGPDGIDRLFALTSIPGTALGAGVAMPRVTVFADLRREMWRSAMQFWIAAAVFIFAVWFGGERLLVRPIGELADVARRLGRGDLSARVPEGSWPAELRTPARAFNAMADRLASREAELQTANERLSNLAAQDGLTGIANRRQFDDVLDREWRRAARKGSSLALMVVDADFFKAFNDCYGHLAGDDVLRRIAGILEEAAVRPADLAARIGGEEFAIVLPETKAQDAGAIAERVRTGLAALEIPHLDSEFGRVTLSIGVAAMVPRSDFTWMSLVDFADAALYAAKRAGRDRVVLHNPQTPRLIISQ